MAVVLPTGSVATRTAVSAVSRLWRAQKPTGGSASWFSSPPEPTSAASDRFHCIREPIDLAYGRSTPAVIRSAAIGSLVSRDGAARAETLGLDGVVVQAACDGGVCDISGKLTQFV